MAVARFRDVSLVSEARTLVEDLIARQIESAARERPAPNQPVPGDAEVKTAFWMLLSLSQQREIFLKHVKNRHFWPRIRTTIGAPPFGFLRAEDEGVVNASGIAIGRAHMVSQSDILASHEVGKGHFQDEASRAYKVVADDATSSEIPVRKVRAASRVVLDVRIAAIPAAERYAIIKSRNPKALRSIVFPRAGERVRLLANEVFGALEPVEITVRTVQSKSSNSPVARLYCSR